ncbi:unnamed protein product [Urochloa humidicola]
MATGDDGQHQGGRYKRCRAAGDSINDDENNLPDKRRQLSAAGADGGEADAGDGTGDYYYNISSDDDEDDDDGGEGLIYYFTDDKEDETEVGESSAIQSTTEKSYVILSEDDIRHRQSRDTAEVAEVLSIPAGFATVLLRHYKWDPTNLQDDWFSDDRRIRAAAGLPADGAAATALSTSPLTCNICFDTFPAGRTRSAACEAHFYCDGCWRGYIHAAVSNGPRCLSLQCPDTSCPAAIVGDLVAAVGATADTERYARFALRSYVEDNGGRIKWCPGRGCGRAVRFVGDADEATTEVLCECGHVFCWGCGEEAHRPVSCGMVRAWLAKNKSDSETANWVLVNTKLCPKCHKAIEKNQGCNHMRCVCGHHFCWLCLKPAGGQHYACDVYDPAAAPGRRKARKNKEDARVRQARTSLDRYLFHYERWVGNMRSLQKAKQDMEEMERSELEGMAAMVGRPVTELAFMKEAYEQVIYGRRVLRWAHAYGYYLDPETDGTKRQLFDFLQSDANNALERLHKCVELERKDVFRSEGEAVDVARRFKEYQQKMLPLTVATRNYMSNLVKAFETDLPEVGTTNF